MEIILITFMVVAICIVSGILDSKDRQIKISCREKFFYIFGFEPRGNVLSKKEKEKASEKLASLEKEFQGAVGQEAIERRRRWQIASDAVEYFTS